jgi:hypothetical protein
LDALGDELEIGVVVLAGVVVLCPTARPPQSALIISDARSARPYVGAYEKSEQIKRSLFSGKEIKNKIRLGKHGGLTIK